MKRRSSKELSIGKVKIGGSNKIAVQSMLNIPPENIKQNVLQAKELKNAGYSEDSIEYRRCDGITDYILERATIYECNICF